MLPPYPVHPEAKKGEICIGNTTLENYLKIGWNTARLGKNAYPIIKAHPCDRYGLVPTPGLFPVFVQETEYYAEGR